MFSQVTLGGCGEHHMILSIKGPDRRASSEVLKEDAGSVTFQGSLKVPCKALPGQAESREHGGCEYCLMLHLGGRLFRLAVAVLALETGARQPGYWLALGRVPFFEDVSLLGGLYPPGVVFFDVFVLVEPPASPLGVRLDYYVVVQCPGGPGGRSARYFNLRVVTTVSGND